MTLGTGLIKYDSMCRAIEAAYEVDEVKDIRDKSLALEALERCEHTWLYPSCPGVYVFDGIEGVLYVGESRNLRKRLHTHERRYLRSAVAVRCRVLPCSNHRQVERWLIDALRPRLNGTSPVDHRLGPRSRLDAEAEFSRVYIELFGVPT